MIPIPGTIYILRSNAVVWIDEIFKWLCFPLKLCERPWDTGTTSGGYKQNARRYLLVNSCSGGYEYR